MVKRSRIITIEPKRGRGRPSLGDTAAMTLRLPGNLPAEIDALLEDREARADFIRIAIEREIARRRRS